MTQASLAVTAAQLVDGKPGAPVALWPMLFAVPLPPPGSPSAALMTSGAPISRRTESGSKGKSGTLIPGGIPATATIDVDVDPFGRIGGWCLGVAAVLTAAPGRRTHPAVTEFEQRLVLALAATTSELTSGPLSDPAGPGTDRPAEQPPAGSALSRMAFGPAAIIVNQIAATDAARRVEALASLRRIAKPHLHPVAEPPPRSMRRKPAGPTGITASALHARLIWPTDEPQRVDFTLRLLDARRSTVGHLAGEYRLAAGAAVPAAADARGSTGSPSLPEVTP